MLDRAAAVFMKSFIIVRTDIAAGKNFLKVLEESRIIRHDVLEVTVLLAVLYHEDVAVPLDNLSFDLANLVIQQDLVR
jgi:hypothetical protein